jgi:hypothetical protein
MRPGHQFVVNRSPGEPTLVITEQTETDGGGKDDSRQQPVAVESTEFDGLARDKVLFILDGLVPLRASETEHIDYREYEMKLSIQ